MLRETQNIKAAIDKKTEVFCAAINNEDEYVAVGCGDGVIRIFNYKTGNIYNSI
jgi:hypothetical protein